MRLDDFLPDDGDVSGDTLLGRFLDYTAGKGLTLYPAQEEAILELLEDKNVIINTPTGTGFRGSWRRPPSRTALRRAAP